MGAPTRSPRLVPLLGLLLLAGCGGDPAEAERKAERALARLAAGEAAEAERLAREAVAEASGSAKAAEALGRVLVAAGRPGEAVAPLKRAVDLGDLPARRGALAEALMLSGKLDPAADALEAALAQAPQDPVLVRLGVLLYPRVGRQDEGLALAQTALALEPGHPPTLVRVALAWLKAGRRDEARTLLRTLDPAGLEDVQDLGLAGTCFYELEEAPRAIAALERAAARAPGNPELQFNLGSVYLQGEQFAKAKDAFERALAADPADAKAMGQVAFCLSRMGRMESARAMLAKARQADPADPVLAALELEFQAGGGEP